MTNIFGAFLGRVGGGYVTNEILHCTIVKSHTPAPCERLAHGTMYTTNYAAHHARFPSNLVMWSAAFMGTTQGRRAIKGESTVHINFVLIAHA